MKVLHTSDWHLGQFFQKAKSREKEHAAFIDWLLQQVVQHDIDAVIVAGDVFDIGAPPSYARHQYADFISRMHRLKCQVVMLAGNHDSISMLNEAKPFLEHLNVHIVSDVDHHDLEAQVISLKNKAGETAALVCAVPFLRPQSMIQSEAGQSTTEKRKDLKDAIAQHYERLFAHAQMQRKALGQPMPVIMTGHLTACNIQTSDSERDIYIGSLDAFPSSQFPAAEYIALGHIHRPQKVAGQEHIRYCGSPIPLSFGELNHQKQVNILHFTGQQLVEVEEIKVPLFQPMLALKGTLDQMQAQLEQTVFDEKKPKAWVSLEVDMQGLTRSQMMRQVEKFVQDYPIELIQTLCKQPTVTGLSKRRANDQLQNMKPMDVFEKRLAQEELTSEAQKKQAQRLRDMFKAIMQDVESLENQG